MNWSYPNLVGSLRRGVAREIRQHARENRVLRRHRYPASIRLLRCALGDRSFGWFIALYCSGIVFAIAFEIAFGSVAAQWHLPLRLPSSESALTELRNLLKDLTSYFLAAQIGVLGAISLAVGLVTIIGQRDDSPTDVQLYYHESLVYEVTASSIALSSVLALQLLWPAQYFATLAVGRDLPASKVALTILHAAWLSLNLAALANFIASSFLFLEPGARERMRDRFTANRLMPAQQRSDLRQITYINSGGSIGHDVPRESATFGVDFGEEGSPELSSTFDQPVLLYDVRMTPLRYALRHWWARCAVTGTTVDQSLFSEQVRLVFAPMFGQTLVGNVVWCSRYGGVPLNRLERVLIWYSFKFLKAPL